MASAARHLLVKAYALACIAFHDSPFTPMTVQGHPEGCRYIFHFAAGIRPDEIDIDRYNHLWYNYPILLRDKIVRLLGRALGR